MSVEIEVYYHTDQTRNLKKMDMNFHITDCETRTITSGLLDAVNIACIDSMSVITL